MITRKLTLKANDGKGIVSCDIEVRVKANERFFYGQSDAEVWYIDAPGWFKNLVREDGWKWIEEQINNRADEIADGYDGMILKVSF